MEEIHQDFSIGSEKNYGDGKKSTDKHGPVPERSVVFWDVAVRAELWL
jgi:hypothetical protein